MQAYSPLSSIQNGRIGHKTCRIGSFRATMYEHPMRYHLPFRFRRSRLLGILCATSLSLQYLPALAQQAPQQTPPQNPPQGQPQQGQQGQNQQGQNQGQQQQGQQGQQNTQTTPNQVNKPTDAISKTREDLAKIAPKAANTRPLTIDTVGPKNAMVNQPITFKVYGRDPSLTSGVVLTFTLYGAPAGANLDPQTGAFSWTPTQAGSYSFFVIVTDNSDPVRMAYTPVTITVDAALQNFGYNFFTAARALIDYRVLALRSGYIPLGVNLPLQNGMQQQGQGANTLMLPGYQQGVQASVLNAIQQASAAQGSFNNPNNNASGAIIPQGQTPLPAGSMTGGTTSSTNPLNPLQGPIGQNFQYSQLGASNLGNGLSGALSNLTPDQVAILRQLGVTTATPNAIGPQNNQFSQIQLQSQGGQQVPTSGQGIFNNNQGLFNSLPNSMSVSGYQQAPLQLGMPMNTNIPQPNLMTQGNVPSIDALRQYVGPWDSLGMNVNIPAPDRYQLGAGDIVTVRFWSPALVAQEVDVKVDERGELALPTSGKKISVRGQTLDQAQSLLKKILASELKNADLSLTLKTLRTMSITVLGDAYAPGNYQLPWVATLFNALYMFGGPADSGSLRKIELRRTDGTTRSFDMYKFLIYKDASQDVPLQPGDTIWIAPAGPRVTVQGEVPRPAIYEITDGEHLRNAIDFAGGAKATGVAQRVSLQTVTPGLGHTLRDVDLTRQGPESDPPVYDGDVAEVFSVRTEYLNRIQVEGAVDQPGDYAYLKGTTVADIIAKARGLLKEAYPVRADLFRQNPDKSTTLMRVDLQKAMARDPEANFELKPFDHLMVYDIRDVSWRGDRQVVVQGAVQKPGQFYRSDNMRVLDVLLQAGGLAPDASAEAGFLQRTNPDGTLGPLLTIDFRRLATGDPAQNVELADKDVLRVQTVQEAHFVPTQTVTILGAVQAPNNYPRATNMKLSDLLKLAGGPTPDASDFLEIAHARVPNDAPRQKMSLKDALAGKADTNLTDGDLVTVAQRNDIQMTTMRVVLMGAVKRPGPYAINGTTDRLSELIDRAGGFAPDAFGRGTEFYRDPSHLKTDSQEKVTPRLLQAINEVAQDDYTRAVAKADVEKARFLKDVNTGASTIALPGVGAVSQPSTTVPATVFDHQTVTPARPLNIDDLTPGGNVNVDLDEAIRHRKGREDLVLKDGDIIVVPETPTTVSVVGAVTVPSAVVFDPGKSLSYYISNTGGYSVDAAKDRVIVLRYGGLVQKATDKTKIQVGDIIWVPTQVMSARLTDKTAEVETVSRTVTSGAVLLAILRALIK